MTEKQPWQSAGIMAFRLVNTGRYRRGVELTANEFTVCVNPGEGTTEADAVELAKKIADLLNAAEPKGE